MVIFRKQTTDRTEKTEIYPQTGAIGGLSVRLPKNLTSLIRLDGVKVHPTLTYTFNDTHSLTFLMIRGKNPGVSYTFSFRMYGCVGITLD